MFGGRASATAMNPPEAAEAGCLIKITDLKCAYPPQSDGSHRYRPGNFRLRSGGVGQAISQATVLFYKRYLIHNPRPEQRGRDHAEDSPHGCLQALGRGDQCNRNS